MLQAQRKKSYRISQNRKKMSRDSPMRGVLMHINTPVLQQYNSIDLRSPLVSHRINHKSLSSSCSKELKAQAKVQTKWPTQVDRYIESKEKILEKKGLIQSSFQFRKLDRRNRFRYIRLTRNQALPADFSRIRTLTQDVSIDSEKQSRRLKTDNSSPNEMEEQLHSKKQFIQLGSHKKSKQIKQRLLNYFIQSYFKNKFKKSFKENVSIKKTTPLKNNYVTRCLMRNNTD